MSKSDNNRFLIIFESIKSKIDFLLSADNALDGKSGTLMGFEIALGIGYISFVIGDLEGIKFYEGVLGLILLTISIILLLIVTWPKDYITYVNPTEHTEYLEKPEEELLLQLISDAQSAFIENSKNMRRKVILYKSSMVLLITSSLLLVLSVIGKLYV